MIRQEIDFKETPCTTPINYSRATNYSSYLRCYYEELLKEEEGLSADAIEKFEAKTEEFLTKILYPSI